MLAKTNPERPTYKPALLSHRTHAGSDALGDLFSKSNHSPGIWPHAEALFATSARDCDPAANDWVARCGLDIRSEELLTTRAADQLCYRLLLLFQQEFWAANPWAATR